MNLLSPFLHCTMKLCAPSSWGTGARNAGGYACRPCREENSLANSARPACRPVQLYHVARGIPLFQTFFFGSCLQGGSHSLAIQYIIPFIHSLLDQLFNELCLMAVDIGLVLDIQICTMLSFCPRRTHIQWGCGGVDNQGVWDRHVHTVIFKMDNQQGPTVQLRELCSMLCSSLDRRSVGGE